MHEFEEGNRVKIIGLRDPSLEIHYDHDDVESSYDCVEDLGWCEDMGSYIGDIYTIERIHPSGWIEIGDGGWSWLPDWLEKIPTDPFAFLKE